MTANSQHDEQAQNIATIVTAMMQEVGTDQRMRFLQKLYRRTFTGREAVRFLLARGYAANEEEAIDLGKRMIAKGYVLPVGHVQPFQNSKVQFRYSTTASQQAERSAAAAAAGGSGSGAGTAADGSDESETETANPLLRRHYMRTARHAKLRLELQQLRAELGAVSHDADIHDLKLAISEQRHGLQAVEYHCRAKTREQSHEVKETGKEIKTQIRRQRDKSLLRAAKAVDLASYQSRFAQDELKDSKDFLNSCYDQILQLERSVESSNRSFAHTLGTYGSGVLLKLLHWLLGLIFFFIIAVSNTTRFFLAQSPPLRIFSLVLAGAALYGLIKLLDDDEEPPSSAERATR